jgi:protein-S-isoprenylcysteine O-methyltransferase Ste14
VDQNRVNALVNVLLTEYSRTSDHLIQQARQKEVLSQVFLGATVAGAGVVVANKLPMYWLSAAYPLVMFIYSMIYIQKEAEYLVAFYRLMAIEGMVNEVLGLNVMQYVHGYKDLVFELDQTVSQTPVRIIQYSRGAPFVILTGVAVWHVFMELSWTVGFAYVTLSMTVGVLFTWAMKTYRDECRKRNERALATIREALADGE